MNDDEMAPSAEDSVGPREASESGEAAPVHVASPVSETDIVRESEHEDLPVDPGDRAGDVPDPAPAAVPETPRAAKPAKKRAKKKPKLKPNNVKKLRIERMMSKAELARRANLSVLTIDRVEKGFGSRMNTKRKILEALGLTLADRVKVFGEEE